jgi:hypothetical protein
MKQPSTLAVHEQRKHQSGVITVKVSSLRVESQLCHRVTTALVFIVSLAYLCIFLRHVSFEPDEGIVLQGAERILRGELPYRDFFTFYTPGSFYLVAFLFKVFGDFLLVARATLAFGGAICATISFLLVRRVCSLGTAIFVAFLSTVTGCSYRFLVLHNWYSTLLCCLSVYAAVRLFETQQTTWAFGTGLLAGLTFLFEQSKGSALSLGLLLGVVILRTTKPLVQLPRRSMFSAAVGFMLPLLITAGFFSTQGSLIVMLQSWLWPLRHYTRANRVSYGWQNWSQDSLNLIFHTGPIWTRAVKIFAVSPGLVVPVLPIIAAGFLLYCLVQIRRISISSDMDWYYVLISSVLVGLLLSVVTVRADVIHFMYLAPLWYVVLGWMFGSVLRNRVWVAVRPYFIMYVALAFGLLGLVLLLRATGAHIRIPTRRGIITVSKNDTVLEFVQTYTSPGQALFVYPYRPLYNYLTATRNPTSFDYFQPGMNTETQALEIIAALKSQPPRAILFEPWFPEKIANSWPGTPLGAIAKDQAADYIVSNYHVCRVLYSADDSEFEFMVSKEALCP